MHALGASDACQVGTGFGPGTGGQTRRGFTLSHSLRVSHVFTFEGDEPSHSDWVARVATATVARANNPARPPASATTASDDSARTARRGSQPLGGAQSEVHEGTGDAAAEAVKGAPPCSLGCAAGVWILQVAAQAALAFKEKFAAANAPAVRGWGPTDLVSNPVQPG